MAGIKDKIVANAQPTLNAGETIEAAFLAGRASPMLGLIARFVGFSAFVVTDQRVLEFKSSSLGKLGNLERELPRSTVFERSKAAMQARVTVGGKTRWVQRGWWPELEAANATSAA